MAEVGVQKSGEWFFLTFTVKDGTRTHLVRAEEAKIMSDAIRRRLRHETNR